MAGQDVVHAENLVVDQALDEIERTPAGENGPQEIFAGPRLRLLAGGPKQQNDPTDGEHPNNEMKETVLRDLAFEVVDRIRLARLGRANHVVPAEDLVEDDAVEETAETEPEDEAGAKERGGFHAAITGSAGMSRDPASPVR